MRINSFYKSFFISSLFFIFLLGIPQIANTSQLKCFDLYTELQKKQDLSVVSAAEKRWNSLVNKSRAKDIPYFALGFSDRLDFFSDQMEVTLNHLVVNYQNWGSKALQLNQGLLERMLKTYHLHVIVMIESIIEYSPNEKVILFNLDYFDLNEFEQYYLNNNSSYSWLGNYTNKELEFLLSDKNLFDHVRWFKNGKELSFIELKYLFEKYNPEIFKTK